jgi:serine protease AprX
MPGVHQGCISRRQILHVWVLFVGLMVFSAAPLHAQGTLPQATEQATVSPYLRAELAESRGDVPILILLKDQPDLGLLEASATSASATAGNSAEERRAARATYLYQQLTAYAQSSQAELRAWLDSQGIAYRPYYIINMIRVRGDTVLVDALRQHPDVARLDADPVVDARHELAAPTASWAQVLDLPEATASPNTPTVLTSLTATRAPEVWALGYRGQGITVASQDTGVKWDHPALRSRYRGVEDDEVDHTYNWLDAIAPSAGDPCSGTDAPCDDQGHGTHTVGTMVGEAAGTTYGMAPDAQWMGCRNMRKGLGSPDTYTACFEFFLAPYPPGGDPFTEGRPELAPDIINNSWGCPPTEGCNVDSLRQVVETVRAAGIMVVASAGNGGAAGCSTVVDPIAIYDATFSVGAHDANGNLAGFSSRGPVTIDGSKRLKPDLTAPGVNVLSTSRSGGYTTLSGTSMASPHVAGAVALLWSATPWLVGNPDLTEQVLLKSSVPVLDNRCGDGSEQVSPNPAFGYGRLDIAAAVQMAQQPWEISVSVTSTLGLPLSGAEVTLLDERTGYTKTATTDIQGTAHITPTLAGAYTLQVRHGLGEPVETENIKLNSDGGASGPRIKQISVLYIEPDQPLPNTHFLPSISAD